MASGRIIIEKYLAATTSKTVIALSSANSSAKFTEILNANLAANNVLMTPLVVDITSCALTQRTFEIRRGDTSINQSQSLGRIYSMLSQTANRFLLFSPPGLPQVKKLEDVESILTKQTQYKRYNGRAPVINDSYYFGTSRRGGVLGDIYIDLDSEEFDASKKKLDELKVLGLSRSDIVSKFIEFFREKILDSSPSSSTRLTQSHDVSRSAGIMPLSTIIFLGHGDCRPHALAVCALLNYAGIKAEHANFKESMQCKDQEDKWDTPQIFDHSVVVYTGEDGKQYIADSYFQEFNNLPLKTLLDGHENIDGTTKYKFIYENNFPTIFVKNPIIHYDNTDFSLRVFGDNGGITLLPRTNKRPTTPLDPATIRDIGSVWDLKKFERGNSPVHIGMSLDRNAFITYQGIRVLDMPIRLRGESNAYKIPTECKMFQETIQQIIDHAHSVSPEKLIKESNTYLTIDQTWVEKGEIQRKPGIHTDGFQGSNMFKGATINHGYVVSNLVPTAFYTKPFYFRNLDTRVHNYNFEMDKQGRSMTPQLTDELGIYLITAYSPHAATVATKSGYRTFLRVLYDKDKYNRYGNSINRLLNYQWDMVANINLSRTFHYMAPSANETSLITNIQLSLKTNYELSSSIIKKVDDFYETLKNKNNNEWYSFIYRILSLDFIQLSSFLLKKLSTQILSDHKLMKLILIPLGSMQDITRKQAENFLYNAFKLKISEGKRSEISGLIYEMTNDPRYKVDKDKFNALFEPFISDKKSLPIASENLNVGFIHSSKI